MSRATSPLRDRMIFLVGARRSGTNWLQRILCARPDVVAVPSETYLFHGVAQLNERFHSAAPGSTTTGLVYVDRDRIADALRDLCDAVFQGLFETLAPNATRMVERTPDHVRYLRLIGEIYPDARIVHIIRDGRDVARSLLSQDWGPSSIEEAAEEWRSAIATARQDLASVSHYHEVRYEQLLADPRAKTAELFTWLALDGSPGAIEAALAEARVDFNVDARAPRVGAEKWRESFSEQDMKTFMRIAGETLTELGYAVDGDAAESVGGERRPRRRIARVTSLPEAFARRRSRTNSTFDRDAQEQARKAQHVVDQVIDRISSRRFDALEALLLPDLYVRIVEGASDWNGRGREARERLFAYLDADPALHGRTVRGDVHPSVPTVTALVSYRLANGSIEDRLLAATVHAGLVTRLTYYRLPLVQAHADA